MNSSTTSPLQEFAALYLLATFNATTVIQDNPAGHFRETDTTSQAMPSVELSRFSRWESQGKQLNVCRWDSNASRPSSAQDEDANASPLKCAVHGPPQRPYRRTGWLDCKLDGGPEPDHLEAAAIIFPSNKSPGSYLYQRRRCEEAVASSDPGSLPEDRGCKYRLSCNMLHATTA